VFFDQMATTATPWATTPRPGAAVGVFLVDLSGAPPPEAIVVVAVSGVLVVLALMARWVAGAPAHLVELDLRTVPGVRFEAVVVAATLAVGTLAAVVSGTTVVSRYAMVVAPLAVVVLAFGVGVLAHRGFRLGLLAVLVAGGLLVSGSGLAQYRTQLGEIATVIAAESSPGDVVAYCPDQLGPAGDRALRQQWESGNGVPLTQLALPTLADPELVDWRNYAERNEAADPAVIADALQASAAGGAVWVVWNPAYRTYEGLCEAVVADLTQRFASSETLVAADPDRFFEHATLTRFGP
jgi:hypothetical protein